MRRFGNLLMIVGAAVGVAAALWVATGVERFGFSWIVAVGLIKLTIVAAIGLMAAGAFAVRIANRSSPQSQIADGAGAMPEPYRPESELEARREPRQPAPTRLDSN